MTFIAALRRDGIAAPCLFDGPINGEVFLAWVRQVLVPTLKPGEIVIMTIPAATAARPCAEQSGRPEPSSCSCPNTPPTSTRSSRSLQSSNTCSGRRMPALMRPCSPPLALFSKATLRKNAPTILQIAGLPGKNGDRGRSGADNRLFVDAVLWVLRTGSPWRDLPEEFGNWNSVFQRFRRWAIKGVWESLFNALVEDPDFEYLMIDATIVRTHQHAAGAKGAAKMRPSGVRAAV